MLKGSDIIGKPIITYDTGKQIAKVTDVIFDHNSNYLLAFLVSDSGLFNVAKVIPLEEVHAIGTDAVIAKWKFAVVSAKKVREVKKILERNNVLKGTKVMTTDGRFLGTIIDLYFDEHNGQIEGYEVEGGMFAHAETRRSFVPAPQTLRIGVDVAFVPPETVDFMEEQIVDIKGRNSALFDRDLPQSSTTSEMELPATELAPISNINTVELLPQEAATVLQPNVEPTEQKAFVIGKTVDRTVITPDGTPLVVQGQLVTLSDVETAMRWGILNQLYLAAGGQVSDSPTLIQPEELSLAEQPLRTFTQITDKKISAQRKSQHISSYTVEQTKGRRLKQPVQTAEGFFIGAQGQIITEKVIEQAIIFHKEQELIAAAGLTNSKLSRNSIKDQFNPIGTQQLASTYSGSHAGDKVTETQDMWGRLRRLVGGFKTPLSEVGEEERIKAALGRRVNRVILDNEDNFILNVGEMITHHAIEDAREAGVLDILLASIDGYIEFVTAPRELLVSKASVAEKEAETG